jgi:chemotaxis protein histidine kinase CheA
LSNQVKEDDQDKETKEETEQAEKEAEEEAEEEAEKEAEKEAEEEAEKEAEEEAEKEAEKEAEEEAEKKTEISEEAKKETSKQTDSVAAVKDKDNKLTETEIKYNKAVFSILSKMLNDLSQEFIEIDRINAGLSDQIKFVNSRGSIYFKHDNFAKLINYAYQITKDEAEDKSDKLSYIISDLLVEQNRDITPNTYSEVNDITPTDISEIVTLALVENDTLDKSEVRPLILEMLGELPITLINTDELGECTDCESQDTEPEDIFITSSNVDKLKCKTVIGPESDETVIIPGQGRKAMSGGYVEEMEIFDTTEWPEKCR